MSLYTLTVDLLLKTGSFERDGGKTARQFEQRMQSMQASARRAGTAIGLAISAGVTAGGAAMVQWTRQVADLGVEYDKLGKLSGTTSEQFQRMAAGANSVGMSHEKLADIFKDVQDKIGDYVQTGGGALADFFDNIAKRTGVTAEQMRKLSGPDALGLYFKSLERANLSQTELTFYMEAIASDASALIPLLRNNSAGFQQWGNAAQAAGAIIDGKTNKATERLRQVTLEADLAFKGLKVSVAEEIIPALSDFSELLNDPDFRQGFGVIVQGLATVTTKAAEAASMIGNLSVLVAQGFKPVGDKSYDGLIQERMRIEEQIAGAKDVAARARAGNASWWEGGLFRNTNSEANAKSWDKYARDREAELVRVDAALKRRRMKDLADAVVVIDNGQALPESALKPDAVGYRPTGNIDKSARDKADAEAKRRADEIARYRRQAQEAAGAMQGPLAEAMGKHLGNMSEYNSLLAKGNIAQADANVLMAQSAIEYSKVAAEVEKALASPESLLATMDAEVAMLGKVGRARELSRRQMMNERDMRQELQKAVEAAGSKEELARRKGVASYEAYERSMLAAARASAELSLRVEEAAANVEAWAGVVVNGVGDAADAMADFVAGGLREFDNLWDDLKDTAKRGLRDLTREFLQQKIVIPIQTQILSGMNGQGGGLNLQSLMGLFGGNGSAAGGQNVSTVAGLLSKGQGLFGFGRSAGAAAGTLSGFGDVTSMAGMTGSSFSGLIGGGSAGAGAGAGAGAAGSAAAAVPIIGWIVAGMMKNAQLFDQGWNIANGESWAGKIATAGAVGLADKGFRALGFNDKVASILSGSSIHAKLFGRQAPKVTGQGITGSYGFGGFDGQSYADIKAKGGLFRSDKKWTQFGALDPGIDRTFDMAARQVRGAATDLAKQLGVDLTQKLGSVRVDLGKLQLSADSSEAKAQLEAYLAEMTNRLYTEAVKAAGFGGQLDGYFESADVFTALSASIALAVGNADELGRALNGLDVDKVNKAVDYFQDLAGVAGTDLATQVQKVTGLLGNYASLMADVSTQLMTANLTQYQSQALSIERTYRQQVKSANDYAKALGLSGARAEDLAKIEALRATNMGKLQAQIDKDKKAMQYGLSISDLSPLTDQEKLGEAMKELERAVSGGDTSAAQAAAQAALGFGRNLYASGQDYNSLYGRVTGLIDGMKVGDLNQQDGTSMGALADAIEALPDNFSRAVFDLVVNNDAQTQTTAAVQQSNALLAEQNQLLRQLVSTTTQGVRNASSSALREALNAR
ncbi:phage tail protein [Stenotrophomonas maltophilia]|uniref:phage tail protein n=1 Tax=Stenotrophomonas maltophilia group sp. Smal13 TaxID=3377166 RepID=UPI001311D7FE|nr:phage tail protein [Stenotrophomonas maltophilia]EKU9957592.1 phage tail protein [Stenotrophomonas maltophilia]EKU9984714.1 phage tail protein [Stenotrophomonas maltophilia]